MATPNPVGIGFDPLELGKEYPPLGESEAIEKLRALLLIVYNGQRMGPVQRGQHAKQHGGVWATFRVHRDIPKEMRVGIFAEACIYTALIRFSNGAPTDEDTKPAAHAMAIKVLLPGDGSLTRNRGRVASNDGLVSFYEKPSASHADQTGRRKLQFSTSGSDHIFLGKFTSAEDSVGNHIEYFYEERGRGAKRWRAKGQALLIRISNGLFPSEQREAKS